MRPLVSIIVPSFNQGRFIAETINSCLRQSYRPLEVIVVDGASTDETQSVLRSFSDSAIRWISEPDEGVCDAVNKGLHLARGEILSIQSSDDLFVEGAVDASVNAFASSPDLGLVYGDVDLIDKRSELIGQDRLQEFNFDDYLGRLQYIPQPGAFFTRAAMLAVGGWRVQFSYAADADYWMRIASKFPVKHLNRKVGRYRYHADQRDANKKQIALDWEAAVLDLIGTGVLSSQEERFARMGIELAKHRYAPERDWWYRTRMLYRAAAINPPCVFREQFPKRDLLPGREPIWKTLSRIKRSLGFRPRL